MTLAELQPEITTYAAYEAFVDNGLVRLPTFFNDPRVSQHFDANITFVSELDQESGGYKERGVQTWFERNVAGTDTIEVVAFSAGNHAAAVALAASEYQIHTRIFMPINTPKQKIENVQKLGGEYVHIELTGETVDDTAKAVVAYLEDKDERTKFVHPFDDPDVVSGQGTLGHDLMDVVPDVDVVIVQVGGGGLLSGLIHATQSRRTKPIHYVAVEPHGAPSLTYNLRHPERSLETIDTFVDGAAVKKVGAIVLKTLEIIGSDNFTIIRPTRDDVRRATTYFWETHESIKPELAGALGFAALPYIQELVKGKEVACLLTGGNLSEERYMEEVRLLQAPYAHVIQPAGYGSFSPKTSRQFL